MLSTLLIPCVAALVVRSIFTTFERYWPMSYFGIDSGGTIDPITNRTPGRFFTWRLGPVFASAAVATVTVQRLGHNGTLACIVFAASYIALSVVPATRNALRNPGVRLTRVTIALHTIIGCLIVATSFVALWLGHYVDGLIPQPSALVDAVWTAALVTAAASLIARFAGREVDLDALVRRSRHEVGNDLISFARERAAAHDADPDLMEAVLLAENLQRPRWVRFLERRKAVLDPRGTYGVMQVSASQPLDDRTSVELAAASHLRGAGIPRGSTSGGASPSVTDAVGAIGRYNGSQRWRDLVSQILNLILESQTPNPTDHLLYATFGSVQCSEDGSSYLQVGSVRQQGAWLTIEASLPAGTSSVVRIELLDSAGTTLWDQSAPTQHDLDTTYETSRARATITLPGHRAGSTLMVTVSQPKRALCRLDIPSTWSGAIAAGLTELGQ